MTEENQIQKLKWNIKQLKDKYQIITTYQDNIRQILYKKFRPEYCKIDYDGEGSIKLAWYLEKITQEDIHKLDKLCDSYTILPDDQYAFVLVTTFKVDD